VVAHRAGGAPRYIAVVRRGESEVYQLLKEYLEARGVAEVVWERRAGDRRFRARASAASAERRGADRRGSPRGAATPLGFFIARAGQPAPRAAR
jgi:hypothetical protein